MNERRTVFASRDEQPLRSELFSLERMQGYGRTLAELHRLSPSAHGGDRLLSRLVDNESSLNEVRALLTETASAHRRMVPAADWLLDNFYLIEEHIRTSKRDLPKGYSRGLPRLKNGQSSGLPRVYDIALERISHGDGLVEGETLLGFLETYQSVSTLTIGELWAIPIMLRLALIENLRRVGARISTDMRAQSEADSWADRMTEVAESDPKSLILLIADMARSDPPMVSSFVAELARKLQGKGSALALPLTWIEQRLSETGLTIERLVQSAMRQQAADQVSISNSIRSLRSLDAIDWREFVESTSAVEATLRADPADCYAQMDFLTRDRYRHVVEETARRGGVPEQDVARCAVELATEGRRSADESDRMAHVGYYLVDKGYTSLRKALHMRLSMRAALHTLGSRTALLWYIGSALVVNAVFAGVCFAIAQGGGAVGWRLWSLALIAFLGGSGFSMTLVNWVVTLFAAAGALPRMDFSAGIPIESRTLVVVPAMLTSLGHIEHLAEMLEVRFLANCDDNLFFGLLTDLTDAAEEVLPNDEKLSDHAARKIEELNSLYPRPQGSPFFLFHRGRRWNPQEGVWMGKERKRGKLSDLNSLLRGGVTDGFDSIVGETGLLSSVKYVITLDTDTQLPRDCGRQLVGSMAHPLNRACYDAARDRVVEGYGILQPRVSASMTGANRSRYARLSGSEPGIDPYTRAVSDVYQDLFGEGSFIGKGIYDVDAFERSMNQRLPENRILSHDLLEGCYARSGLVSDLQLFEESPSAYRSDVKRRRRWIRGDWQLLGWLLPSVAGPKGQRLKNPISALSKWKLLDNLRRSLGSALLLVFLFLGWALLPRSLGWTLAAVGILLIPSLLSSLVALFRRTGEMLLGPHLVATLRATARHLAEGGFTLACLPYDAWFSLGAICRSLWRMLVSRRHLLEWQPSEQQDRMDLSGLGSSFLLMWAAPALAFAVFIVLGLLKPASLPESVPFLLLWLLSPAIAWWISRPRPAERERLSVDQGGYLRRLGRKTWAFFETFVNEEENWLPPDNIQELPLPKVAHRTSPTNMGLALLANLAAHDLGYISAGQLVERTRRTLDSMAALERYRDHFYNWYETRTLQALQPRYISTVDSGNLAAYLITLRAGLAALPDEAILSSRLWQGMTDTLDVLAEKLGKPETATIAAVRVELEAAMDSGSTSLSEARKRLVRLGSSAQSISVPLVAEDSQAGWWRDALVRQCTDALAELDYLVPGLPVEGQDQTRNPRLRELAASDAEGHDRARERLASIEALTAQIDRFAVMDFAFLYDGRRHLLSIGYMVDSRRLDPGYYDLLASEARLASFMAIALGQVPQESWFTLGRLLADTGGGSTLFSWSGSMFEYLMPLLVMPTYGNTLLDASCRSAVLRQIEYGKLRAVPWGISESGYNSFDAGLNYQYRAFGVPGLGLKRGLVDDLVIAPYATALALMLTPRKACQNLQRLSGEGFEGAYGLYEAIDFTESRLPSGQTSAIVRSFMAHHQGMSLLSLTSCLLDRPMQRRFDSIPQIRATALLLEEKIPRAAAFQSRAAEMPEIKVGAEGSRGSARSFGSPDTPIPEVHLLSNGRYHVMVTNAGGGYSRWKDLAITRWREDPTRDNWGTFLYLRDVESGELWSNAYQPTLKRPEQYEAIFSEGRAEYRRRDNDLDTYTEIAVSPEDDIELRRVRITNRSRTQRTIEITSYAEVVLAPQANDAAHPGFSNLFVQTQIIEDRHAILCTRRPRSPEESVPWMLHLMMVRDAEVLELSYETDRARFIGRGGSIVSPKALKAGSALSGSQGSVLDPIVSISCRFVLEPERSTTIDLVTGIGESRERALALTEKYQGKRFANRAFELAATHSQVVLQQINGIEADAQLFGRLAGSILYHHSGMRAEPSILLENRRGQSGLWGYSISGDLPIVLLIIKDPDSMALVRQLVQAHAYWRQKGLAVDLMIWNEEQGGYRQQLQDQILALITAGIEANIVDRPGGIFIRSPDQMSNEDRILIQSAARVLISDSLGTLEAQIGGRRTAKIAMPRLAVPRTLPRIAPPAGRYRSPVPAPARPDLLFYNGLGGFSRDGREYVTTLDRGQVTPAPWTNVIANPKFGTVVSEAGMAYTWSENAHEFRLTPWNDDPVGDTSGEAHYLRDEETGHYWSPAPLPRPGEGPYVVRHGFGYTVFEHSERGIVSELWIYVAVDASVKFSMLKVRNESGRTRRLSSTAYVELVLGELRSKSAMHVVTELDSTTGAILARNRYNTEFAGRVVFFDAGDEKRSLTCDGTEFIGRNGSLEYPDAMSRSKLSGRFGAALDPCAAIQIPFELEDGEEREIVFKLGAGQSVEEVRSLVQRLQGSGEAADELDAVRSYWTRSLDAVRIETPDTALDLLTNGWLMYQTLSCRFWGRSGYYQSGGAFGFRDQLQDAMALAHIDPGFLRDQLLLCASRQFPEGDVQHWWHPPTGRGSRTRCSDDYLWLPLAAARYVALTGDRAVLDEVLPFVEGRPVNPGEDSYYDLPGRSELGASLYEHCLRALLRSEPRGSHGLPLMGSGDWNDGMNMVGAQGLGESVWLGFFLHDVLTRFGKIALMRDDQEIAGHCREQAQALRESIDGAAWDGQWYRRAYFDDGSPLGSAGNPECQIDSLSQSWSVLSGAGIGDRPRIAMQSLDRRLVRRDRALIQLLDPPFDSSGMNPGYIKGYVPGVRENGGQYTHAAIWAAMAFAAMGDPERSWELARMLIPLNHADAPGKVEIYKVEPYVMAADIYSLPPHTGRGGWTWYTGSAGWMYRLVVESLMGLDREADILRLKPCIPPDWPGFTLHYRYGKALYHIVVRQGRDGAQDTRLSLDGVQQDEACVKLVDDGREHQVEARYHGATG